METAAKPIEPAPTVLPKSSSLYGRLLKYIWPYKKVFALAVLGMAGIAATEPIFPAIMKYLIDKGFQTPDQRLIWAIPLGIVLLFTLRGVLSFCTNYLMTWISTRLVIDLRRQLFAKILKLPTQAFHEQSGGKLISRVIYDTDNVNQAATNVLVTLIREALTAISLLAYLLYLDWKLTLIILCIGPLIALILKGMSLRIRAASRASFEAIRAMAHTIEETANSHKAIKIFAGQDQLSTRFFMNTERFRRSMMREAIPASSLTPVTHIVASVAVAGIIYLALNQSTGEAGASAGGFISFIAALLLLISPIKQLTAINPVLQRGLAASESIFSLLDSPDELDSGSREMGGARGVIDFDHVSFSYPGAEQMALKDVSFHIDAGQTVALVGASGGGKTTISSLLPRFYRPTSGQILLDGVDINAFNLNSLRHHIALVSQDIELFNDSVESNIAFGAQNTFAREDVIAAAKAAYAWDFIQQLPEGLDTFIGEDGAKLSGGQRQRIAIARALLKNAPILILDEATSALDTESERQVQAALITLMKGRTTLLIAHRLSTIEHADNILVLDQGRIVECGTHQELLLKGKHYANLNRMQS